MLILRLNVIILLTGADITSGWIISGQRGKILMILNLATVGDNCIDCFLSPIGITAVGGNAVNVGVHLARSNH